jgi:hypothetical protein
MDPYNKRNVGPEDIFDFQSTTYSLRSEWTKTAGGGGTFQFPFQLTAGTTTFNIRYGTVEDIAPTDVGTNIAFTDDATNTVFIDCTIDADGIITAAAIDVATTGLPTDTAYAAYKLVGEVIAADGVITTINQSLMFSQGFQACNRDPADPETTPGTYQFFVD